MAMKLPTPPTHAPTRGLPLTRGSFSTDALRILARPLGESASPAISGTTFERSRIRPLSSTIPGFSRPSGPKRTSFMAHSLLEPKVEGGTATCRQDKLDHASDAGAEQAGPAGSKENSGASSFGPGRIVCPWSDSRTGHCCLSATQLDYRVGPTSRCGFYNCIPGGRRTGLPHAPGPRAKLQATRVQWATRWQARSSGPCRANQFRGGWDEAGASWPCSRLRTPRPRRGHRSLYRARKRAAVDQQILAGDVAGLG